MANRVMLYTEDAEGERRFLSEFPCIAPVSFYVLVSGSPKSRGQETVGEATAGLERQRRLTRILSESSAFLSCERSSPYGDKVLSSTGKDRAEALQGGLAALEAALEGRAVEAFVLDSSDVDAMTASSEEALAKAASYHLEMASMAGSWVDLITPDTAAEWPWELADLDTFGVDFWAS